MKNSTFQALSQAVLASPTDPQAWLQLGLFLEAGGRTAEATQCFERALHLDESLEEARAALARLMPPPEREDVPDMRAILTRGSSFYEGSAQDDQSIGEWRASRPSYRQIRPARLLLVVALLALCGGACVLLLGVARARSQATASGEPSPPATVESVADPAAPVNLPPTWTPIPTPSPSATLPPRPTQPPRPTATVGTTPSANGDVLSPQAYRTMVDEVNLQYDDALSGIVALVNQAEEQPSVMSRDEWQTDLLQHIALVEYASRTVSEAVPPPSYRPIHDDFLTMVELYNEVLQIFLDSPGTVEADERAEVLFLIEQGNAIRTITSGRLP